MNDLLQLVEAVFSIVASVAALWAARKSHQVLKLVRGREDRNE